MEKEFLKLTPNNSLIVIVSTKYTLILFRITKANSKTSSSPLPIKITVKKILTQPFIIITIKKNNSNLTAKTTTLTTKPSAQRTSNSSKVAKTPPKNP